MSGSRMGERRRRCRRATWVEGTEGVHKVFQYPSWDGSEEGEEAFHTPTSITYVTEDHFSFVKGTLT